VGDRDKHVLRADVTPLEREGLRGSLGGHRGIALVDSMTCALCERPDSTVTIQDAVGANPETCERGRRHPASRAVVYRAASGTVGWGCRLRPVEGGRSVLGLLLNVLLCLVSSSPSSESGSEVSIVRVGLDAVTFRLPRCEVGLDSFRAEGARVAFQVLGWWQRDRS